MQRCHPERSEGPGREVARRSILPPPPTQVPPYARDDTRSPDPHAILRLHVELVAFLDAECFVPGVHVTEWREGADVTGRVGIRRDLLPEGVVAHHRPPHLSPPHEHTLLSGEAIEHGRGLSAQ